MTEKTLAPPQLARYAPVVLACCGVLSLWLGPTIWLHESQHQTIMEVKADLSTDIQEVKAGLIRLEGKVDQLILHLMEAQP